MLQLNASVSITRSLDGHRGARLVRSAGYPAPRKRFKQCIHFLHRQRLIRAIHEEWGEPIGTYDEFRFFTGLRQSEQLGLRTSDCNVV
jgi:hypothetical protein